MRENSRRQFQMVDDQAKWRNIIENASLFGVPTLYSISTVYYAMVAKGMWISREYFLQWKKQ